MALAKDTMQQTYPMTRFNFLVQVAGAVGTASFTEVTGMDAAVDVIEYRQGNSGSLAKAKIPGLVKHGNITLKMGYIAGTDIMAWARQCLNETNRDQFVRKDMTIELINPVENGTAATVDTNVTGAPTWTLKNAWICSYKGADLDAKSSEVAIETLEVAYEELIMPEETTKA